MPLSARTLVSLCLRLLALCSLLGLAACTARPPVSPLPAQYTVYPGATPGLLKTTDGLTLFSQWWRPKTGEPRAVVILLHGTAAHTGVYAPWAEYLTSQGYALFGFDMRGWGQSQGFGRRAYVRSHDEYVDDLQLAFAEVQRVYPGTPVFLQGESLGGAVALRASIRGGFPLQGLILNAPPLQVNFKVGPGRMANWLAAASLWVVGRVGWVAPNAPIYPMQYEGALSWVWSKAIFDEFSREMLKQEPHITHSAIAAAYLTELGEGAAWIRANLAAVREPFILLQGEKDYLVSTASVAEVLMEDAGSARKTRWLYAGMSHCTLHDTNRGAVWADIVAWLDARVPAPPLSEAARQARAAGEMLTRESPQEAYVRMQQAHGMRTWRPGTARPAPAAAPEAVGGEGMRESAGIF